MRQATAPSDEQLFQLLREADPLSDIGSLPGDGSERLDAEAERLLERIVSRDRAVPARGAAKRAVQRRRAVLGASAGSLAVAAVVAVLLSTAGDAPTPAFAGWQATPTRPASGQVQAAEGECRRNAAVASLRPSVVDTRGPYTLLVYTNGPGDGLCVTGPSLQSPAGDPPFSPFRGSSTSGATVHSATIQRTDTGMVTAKASPDAVFSFNVGRAGANVNSVTLVLEDGTRVEATVSNGWFAADWPGHERAETAEITASSGITTQQLAPVGA